MDPRSVFGQRPAPLVFRCFGMSGKKRTVAMWAGTV